MLPIRWRVSALDELDAVVAYIAQFNPAAADALHERIESSVLPLSEHPYLFRPGRIPGTRELVAHPNYIVVYHVLADCVEIVSVMHDRSRRLLRQVANSSFRKRHPAAAGSGPS